MKKILKPSNSDDNPPFIFTSRDLDEALKKMKRKGAPGPDDIPPSFLKELGPKGREELLHILNTSFSYASVPQSWRNAIIIPLLKAGKPATQLSSFRPISLTSCIVKVLERMLASRIYDLAESKHWFSDLQAGFRKGRSCVDQILRIVHGISDGFQKNPMQRSVLALLDLSKAYDKVWQQKLILSMHHAGVPLNILRWVSAFLGNRQAKVRFNNVLGDFRPLRQGLPQGSVLAPLLFLFYINTLTDSLPSTNINSLFADDISILATDSSLLGAQRKTQQAVDVVADWAEEYKMELSTKSEVTFFTTHRREAKWKPNVLIRGTPITFEPSPRLLGVYLDRELAFTKQLEEVKRRVNEKCRMIAAVSHSDWGWRKPDLMKVYNAHVKPILDFGAHAWQPWLTEVIMRSLEVPNNKALRLVTGHYMSSPIEAIIAESGSTSYKTSSDRLVLSAHEKALRQDANHPSRLAIDNPVPHRLHIRSSFAQSASRLSNKGYLPEDAHNRLPLTHFPTRARPQNGSTISVATDLPGEVGKTSGDELLRSTTMEAVQAYSADFIIYTDGSASEGTSNGGAAAVITRGNSYQTPDVIDSIKKKGRSITCSYEEEVEAMQLAACWIEQQSHFQLIQPSILICTDSRALYSALLNPTTSPIQDLHRRLCSLAATVKIQWVPAHVNVPGNELADQAAKDATQLDEPSVGTSYGSIKQWIKRAIQDPPISHQRIRETYAQYSLKKIML